MEVPSAGKANTIGLERAPRELAEGGITLVVFIVVAGVFALAALAQSPLAIGSEGALCRVIVFSRQSTAVPDLDLLPPPLSRVFYLGLLAWLAYVAVADVRRGEVSGWATMPALLSVCLARLLRGEWVLVAMLSLVIVAGVPLLRRRWPRMQLLSLALTLVCIGPAFRQSLEVAAAVWIACFLMWCMNVLGGADVKVLMLLTGLFPDIRFVYALVPAWLLLSLAFLLVHHRRTSHLAVALSGALLMRSRLPTVTEMTDRAPALPAIALAAIAYLWVA